jgi:hypothetical protein
MRLRHRQVVQAFVAALEADAALVALIGLGPDGTPNIYRSGANRAERIPAVEWRLVFGSIRENTDDLVYQFDIYARGTEQQMDIQERIVEDLLPQYGSGSVTLDGLTMLASMEDGSVQDHPDPEPGVVHTSLDIRFEPAKQVV